MSFLQDKLKKVNPKQMAMAMFALPLAIAVLFFYFVYMPYSKKNDQIDEQIQKNESEIVQGQVMQRKLTELKAANEKLQEELKAVAVQLPSQGDDARVPDMLTDLVKSAGLQLKSVTPQAKTPGPNGLYFETPIKVELSGGYHAFGRFLESVDRNARLLTVSEIDMSSAKPEGRSMDIPIKLTVLAFTSGGGK